MEETSVAMHEGISVTISVADLSELQGYKAKYNDLLSKYDTLKSEYDSLDIAHRKDVAELNNLSRQSSQEKNRIQNLEKEMEATNNKLINMAANFLFIPYEAYGIEKIAIPAFEAITNTGLKEKHRVRYILLKRYKDHVKELRDFLVEKDKDLEHFAGKEQAMKALNDMKQKNFYAEYEGLGDNMKYTYLGKKIIEVERQLKIFDGSTHKLKVKDIIEELDACIKTQEGL